MLTHFTKTMFAGSMTLLLWGFAYGFLMLMIFDTTAEMPGVIVFIGDLLIYTGTAFGVTALLLGAACVVRALVRGVARLVMA